MNDNFEDGDGCFILALGFIIVFVMALIWEAILKGDF